MRPPSRPARLRALELELRQLADEYQDWQDALPENMADGLLAERLTCTISTLEDLADELSWLDIPYVGRRL